MEDAGESAWKQKDFTCALVFYLRNLSASDVQGDAALTTSSSLHFAHFSAADGYCLSGYKEFCLLGTSSSVFEH